VLVFLEGMKPAMHSHGLVNICQLPSLLHNDIGLLKLEAVTVAFCEHFPVTFLTAFSSSPATVLGKCVRDVVEEGHTS
jgi:hypothetical protein